MPNNKVTPEIVHKEDKLYKVATDRKKFTRINYRALASSIVEGDSGTVLKLEVTRKDIYESIKKSLASRGLVFKTDYQMMARTIDNKKLILITVL